MNGVFLIISALLPFVVSELQQYKVINPQLGALITGIEGAASTFTTEISSGNGVSLTATTLLAAITAATQVLQTQTKIDPTGLAIIGALDKAATAGMAVYPITSVDPTQLAPIGAIQ